VAARQLITFFCVAKRK